MNIVEKTLEICDELSQNFIDFSYEANSQRAFADARDGLKPGQRACLWEMYSKGYSSSKPHVKSAKISGGTIGSWWPHGDAAIYDTFARMSQPWINNIPEVDWHGANGSIQISGEPASSRYTEARLSKTSEDGLLSGIKKNNVPMRLNFSEDDEWPEVLPALYPRLMVNGCQGIGSTIANVWLPHALDEVAESIKHYLSTGTIDYSQLAPSFPTGGIIINKDDMHIIYETGAGRVVLRGKTEIKGNSIFITELPYQVYVEPFIDEVKQLILKDEIKGIGNILNKSNKKQLLIEVECDEAPLAVLTQLFNKTDLQKTFNANQYALVGKTPKFLTYKEYLDIYLQHNYDCIKREYEFDLNKSKARLEIVEGLVKALEDIDNIITLIKKSDSSKDAIHNLIKVYSFSENQAKAIVAMRLGTLAHLEKIELEQEKVDLTSNIKTCEEVIGNKIKQQEIYLERFNAFIKKYPNPRKTELTQITITKEDKEIVNVEPEKCVVVMTEGGTIKRVPSAAYRIQKRNGKGARTQDDITNAVIRTNTIDSLMIFTNKGKMYRLLVNDIPEGTNVSKGQSIKSLIEMEPGEEANIIYSIYRDTDAKYVMFVTKNGLIKKTPLEEFVQTKKKSGVAAITLMEGDALAAVTLLKDEQIVITTNKGMIIRFKSDDITATGRVARGVKAIGLADGDSITAALPIRDLTDDLAVFSPTGLGKRLKLTEVPLQARGGKGSNFMKAHGITAASLVNNDDNILIVGDTTSICIACSDISVASKTSEGVSVIKTSRIKSVSKV